MRKYYLYKILRPLDYIFMKVFFRVKIINKNNVVSGKVILAGNHTSYLDPLLLMSSTKRVIRFLAKKELHKGVFAWFFKATGTVPVNRGGDTKKAREMTVDALNNEEIVAIFPEGTINKTKDAILPFKKGAVNFAIQSNAPIVPFVIKGKYKMFRKSVTLKYLKPMHIKNIVEDNEELMKRIRKELENE